MHEWALAESVIATARNVAEKEKMKKITEIIVKIGELQTIEKEIFEFAMKEVMRENEPMLKDAIVLIKPEKVMLKCRICGNKWSYHQAMKSLDEDARESIHFIPETAHVYIHCPNCNSPDFEIVRGRGVWIEEIIGEK
jgi:hydrogenase nickel incorporation protein HypA/HybF